MKKDNVRDYVTAAFRYWALLGCPSYDEAKGAIKKSALSKARGSKAAKAYADAEINKKIGELEDVRACEEAFKALEASGRGHVCQAVKEIYMVNPNRPIHKNELSGRVVRFSMDHYYSERQVYYFLHEACLEFAYKRGLRIEEEI